MSKKTVSGQKFRSLQKILESEALLPYDQYVLFEESILKSVEKFLSQFKLSVREDCNCPLCKELKSRMDYLQFIKENVTSKTSELEEQK